MRRPTASTSASRCRPKPYSYLVPVSNFGTVEQLWDANGKVLAEISKTVLREGTGGANDTTAFAARPRVRRPRWRERTRASATSSGIRSAPGLVYLQSEAAPAGRRTARRRRRAVGRGARGRRRWRAAVPAAKDRVFVVVAAVRRERREAVCTRRTAASRRPSSAPDGKTLFVNEGNDLYAVRLADPSKHYEIAKGATIAAGGRGGRGGGGGGGGGRGGAQSDSAFFANGRARCR